MKLMDNRNCIVSGENVAIYSLCDSNREEYLSVYKRASAFAELYEKNLDLWKFIRNYMEESFKRGEENVIRYLIAEKDTDISVGYFNLTYSEKGKPEVDIAVVKEYRRKGYAFEAAKLLIEDLFEKGEIKSVIWSAFSSNAASRRIAEKLGGVRINGRNLVKEALMDAGVAFDFIKPEEKLLETVTYEIKKG